jgi:anti-sigma B factor antagonist
MDILYQTLEGGVVLVRLNGRLDATTSPEVRETLQTLLEQDQPKIIIDLQDVPFIDSSGLASLVSGLRRAREKAGTIALSGIQPQAQTVFRLTMLDRIFPIHPTYNDAKQSLV